MAADTTDAVVIGAGPNGLAAAALLARKGWDVTVIERDASPGGAVRSEQLTEPGFVHDPFAAFFGLLHSSPAFDLFDLADRVPWARFASPAGALLAPERGAFVWEDQDRTADGLAKADPSDAEAWRELMAWWDRTGTAFLEATLRPLPSIRPGLRFARRVGIRRALPTARMLLASAETTARDTFASEEARTLFAAGISHADVGVDQAATTPQAMILATLAQRANMPVPVGGAGVLTDALVAAVTEAGGTVRCGDAVTRVIVERKRAWGVETASGGIVRARHAVIADTGALALCRDLVGEEHLPSRFLDGLQRFRYGTGVFKLDVALDGPVPWLVPGAESCGVVHVTGDLTDLARASFEARHGLLPTRPMLVVGQQTVADPSRAPEGKHTLWIETHTPSQPVADGATGDPVGGWDAARDSFAERVLDLIESHAPGFRARIRATSVLTPPQLEQRNPNLVGGDNSGGSNALDMQLVFRPVPGWFRYRMPVKGLYLGSASAHPGGGVHLMCGVNAARRALRDARRPGGILRTAGGARRSPHAP